MGPSFGSSSRPSPGQPSSADWRLLRDTGLAAIDAGDAASLRGIFTRAAESKTSTANEDYWRAAGQAGHAEVLDLLHAEHKDRRDFGRLFFAAWQGAINAGNAAAIAWLEDYARPSLNYEEKANLAGLALRQGDETLALRLLQPTLALGPAMAERRKKLLVDFLHVCAANGRGAMAVRILGQHFAQGDGVFSHHNDAYFNILVRALTGGHAGAFAQMAKAGHDYLTDEHIDRFLVMALDKRVMQAVPALVALGADPAAHDSASVRHVARLLAEAEQAVATGQDFARDARDERRALLKSLLHAGGSPQVAQAQADLFCDSAAARAAMQGAIARMEDQLQGLHAERLQIGRPRDSGEALRPDVQAVTGRYESFLHQAARHRLLDRYMRVTGGLDADCWQAKNPAGQTLLGLAIASGHLPALLSQDLWLHRGDALRDFLALVPEKMIDASAKAALVQQMHLAGLKARAQAGKWRLRP